MHLTYVLIHLWHVLRVCWTTLLHLLESRAHPVKTWRAEVGRSVIKLRRTETRSILQLWCWWSAPKLWRMLEMWIGCINMRGKVTSVWKIHRVMHNPSVHHHSGVLRSEDAMGRR